MDGTRLTLVATGWHTRRRIHRYKCRTMGRERGLFRGCVKKFNRRMRSDALVMHPSGASRPICQIEADGGTKETRGFPGTEAPCPSSSNYQAFIPWKRPPFLSLPPTLSAIGLSVCHGVIKNQASSYLTRNSDVEARNSAYWYWYYRASTDLPRNSHVEARHSARWYITLRKYLNIRGYLIERLTFLLYLFSMLLIVRYFRLVRRDHCQLNLGDRETW